MRMTWCFKFHLRRNLVFVVWTASLLQSCFAQAPINNEDAKSILRLSEGDQLDFAKAVLDQHFPEIQGDKFSILLVNRSQLVVPLIESKIEEELRKNPRAESFIDLASAMISYAGDEQALKAINQLIQTDEKRFGSLVERTLSTAAHWRNPFELAYRGLEIGEAIAQRIGAWADSTLTSRRMQRIWAESMLERYGKVPDEKEWIEDPIASRLKISRPENLREGVIGFAKEATAKRENRR
ncbi:MAG: hypothetical protein ABJF23_30790 [Bryobacteraceae bacterium]